MDLLRRAAIALVALLSACDFVHDPTPVDIPGQVVVHAMLAAGTRDAAVLITEAGTRGEGFQDSARPVSGAEVALTAGTETVRLAEAPVGFRACANPFFSEQGVPPRAGPGCYAARVAAPIRSGARYTLHIRLPGGREITGEATVPEAPVVLEPAANARIVVREPGPFGAQRTLVPVRFDLRGAAAGNASILPLAAFEGGAQVPGAECYIGSEPGSAPGAASVLLTIFGFGCGVGPPNNRRTLKLDSLRAGILVTAYDSAYVRYLEIFEDDAVQSSVAAQGISGAYGLFAGEASAGRTVTLLPEVAR